MLLATTLVAFSFKDIIAGPEFGDRQGHTLVIRKALYGLKSSGLRWHEHLFNVLRDVGFIPSRAEHDIWMRDCLVDVVLKKHCEFIPPFLLRPNVVGRTRSSPNPNLSTTACACTNQSTDIFCVSFCCTIVFS